MVYNYNEFLIKEHNVKISTKVLNIKCNIYFTEHTIERQVERNITSDDIISVVNIGLNEIIRYSLFSKFQAKSRIILRKLDNFHPELNIPISIVPNDNEYDVFVHTIMEKDEFKVGEGQYIISIDIDEEIADLYQLVRGKIEKL